MPKLEASARTCFLFLPDTPSLETYRSLVLDEKGTVIEGLAERNQEDFLALQTEAKTYIILPASIATLYHLTLPRLSEKKAATAITFSLEEKLAQPLTDIHLAWIYDFTSQSYTIAVIDKALFQAYLTLLDPISFNLITLDAYALNIQEAIDTQAYYLLCTDTFHGAIPHPLLPLYNALLKEVTCLTEPEPAVWIAKRLLAIEPLNLCQGEFKRQYTLPKEKKLYLILGIAALAWLVTLFLYQGVMLYKLHHHLNAVDDQIAGIYQRFFPGSHQVISPRFRIEQYLKHQHGNTSLWMLIDKLSKASPATPYTLQTATFNHDKLSLTLQLKDFDTLDKLTKRLRDTGLHVKQTEASQEPKGVSAHLELTP